MVEAHEYAYRVKRFFKFYPKELGELMISILVVTFVWAFDDKAAVFSMGHWIGNFITVFIMVAITFFLHVSAQKLYALWVGFRFEYHYWLTGMLVMVMVTLLSRGKVSLILPGSVLMYHLAKQRIGEFRYGLNSKEAGMAATMGPVANVLFAMFVKFWLQWTMGIQGSFLENMYWFNLVFAFFMMLPIPPLPGIIMFWGSKMTYVFFFCAILGYVLLAYVFGIYSLIISVIFSLILWGLFWYFIDR